MSGVRALILVGFGVLAGTAQAQVTEIYKCVDANGKPLYTSDKRDTAGRKCELVSREVNVVPAQKQTPSAFPRESASDRLNAANRQRSALEQELRTEEGLLAKAKSDLAAQEAVRNGDERNYARVLERLKPFQEDVALHQKNVDALRNELSRLR
jgi:hypothetical protein